MCICLDCAECVESQKEQVSNCKHENRTIDCVCNDCGYDLIVEPLAERYRQQERERIIKLLEEECAGDWPKVIEVSLEYLTALIKDETKNIRSQILPDGTIYIEEVKGENK